MRRWRSILCGYMVAAAATAVAQSYITPVRADLTPPTPQSSRPVEYQMPQPAMLTGAVDLSIPIYNIVAGDISLPITLQYRTNGIKVLDDLAYSYDGNRVTSIENQHDGTDFYGRTGYPAGEGLYEWDDAGRMTADSSRGILSANYDYRNLPTQTVLDNGNSETNLYDAAGLLRATHISREKGLLMLRTYTADRVFYGTPFSQSLQYSYFTGGYFDGNGAVHYMHTDYQGSVVMVTDSTGAIEQHISYYPYGEPHRNPAGQPILYAGKERMSSTDDYNFDARRYHAPAMFMSTPDAAADNYYNLSPYAFCRSNPILYVEKDGNFNFKWMADFSRWMTKTFSRNTVRPVYENKNAKSKVASFYYDEVSVGKDGLTITRHIKFNKSAAKKMQTIGFATAVVGYAMTLSVTGAEFGVPIAKIGGEISKVGTFLEFGIDLLNTDFGNLGWDSTKILLSFGGEYCINKLLPANDIGNTVLKDGANLKINLFETMGDMFIEHKQNERKEDNLEQIEVEIEDEINKKKPI